MNPKIKRILPRGLRKKLSRFKKFVLNSYYFIRCSFNKFFLLKKLAYKYNKLHLGCGDIKLKDAINLDFRATSTTDIVHNCTNLSVFPPNSFSLIYAHAFFEHLYRNDRVKCLKSAYRVLKNDGFVIFAGIPDFERIAQAYLRKEPGIVSKTFDLFNVYRYTHGDPEQYPDWWLAQLHKSLFDTDELKKLLTWSGFKNFCIFRYRFAREKIPLSLGFAAFKRKPDKKINLFWLKNLLSQFPTKINLKSLKIEYQY